MRTPGAPVWTGTVAAMGATPTSMPWGEVYAALQSDVIDAAEAQLPAVVGARLDEVVSHITKTGHINLITGVVTSAAWFDGLPEDLQTLLREEALKAGDIASYGTVDSLGAMEAELVEKGVNVREVDVTPFIESTASVYEVLGYSELREQLIAAMGE